MKRAPSILLVAVALGMLAYRFTHLDHAPFARDEPQFLAAAREQLRTGHWLSANPLYGNLNLRYGAASFWFYGVVQFAFGDAPRTAILAMGLALTVAYLAFAVALTRLLDETVLFLAGLLAWMASSPYEFHWSRMAWDLTSYGAVLGAAAILCASRDLRTLHALALGLVLGIGLSTHPSVFPFVIAVAVVLLFEWRAGRFSARAVVSLAGALTLVCLPYLLYLLRARIVERAPHRTLFPGSVATLILMAPSIATPWRLEAFYDEGWLAFRSELGRAATLLDVLAVVSLGCCVAATVAGLFVAILSEHAHRRRLARIGLLSWGGTVALLAELGLETHAHYQFGAAWVPIFGVASCLAWLRAGHPRAGALALALLGAIAVAQFAVVVGWMGYLGEHGGTRTPAYGSTLGTQDDAMRVACTRPERTIVLENQTTMYPFPFEYLAITEAACRDKRVVVCAGREGGAWRACQPPTPGEARLQLRYAHETGGALRIVPLGQPSRP